MPAPKKRYIRNNDRNPLVFAEDIFNRRITLKPRGEFGDTIPVTKDDLDKPEIQKLLAIDRVELTNTIEINIPPQDTHEVGVLHPVKAEESVTVLTSCLGVKKDGKFCGTQVTYRGPENPPLCRDHKNQIDNLEWVPDEKIWRRKEE